MKHFFRSMLVLCLAVVAFVDLSHAQDVPSVKEKNAPTAFWPSGIAFDEKIPTPAKHFGFPVGMRHLRHDQIVSYVNAVAKASSRVKVLQYGKTHGGRPLLLVSITSPANRRRIKEIQRQHLLLAQGQPAQENIGESETSEAGSADESIDLEKLPAVINMGYGVHGDEPSATNCTPLVLHYLAAAKGRQINELLNKCVILLDPSLNPDGFNRFAGWANRYRGRLPNADPQHVEHNQGWPPGRVNYYWFDLNRDWLPLEQPESRARMGWYHRWKPNVVLDFHEMGTQSTYFFQPGVKNRKNPLTPATNVELTRKFADFHSKALDKRGTLYFTGERFDDFYMGKGSTYPDLHGAVGILFEQASSRGHVQLNQDGRLTFANTIGNQFTTTLSSLRATVALKKELLDYKRDFYRKSAEMASADETKTLVFTAPHNRSRLLAFADVLRRHDIQSYLTKQQQTLGEIELIPEESLIVPMQQSEYRFLKSLLMREKNFEENVFYDVSTWTLPLAYGLQQQETAEVVALDSLELSKPRPKYPQFKPTEGALGYIVDFREDQSVWLLGQLLKSQVNVRVATKSFGFDGKTFGEGSLLIPLGVQRKKTKQIHSALSRAVRKGVKVYPIKNGLAENGIDIGSPSFIRVKNPNVVMPTGVGVSAYAAGQVWHLLDVKHAMQLTMLDVDSIAKSKLDDYSVMILPPGGYMERQGFGTKDWKRIRDWASGGRTVVAFGSSVNAVQKSLLKNAAGSAGASSQKESSAVVVSETAENKTAETNDDAAKNRQLPFGERARTKALKLISGAIFNVKIDRTHPLLYGFTSDNLAVFRDHENMLKPSKDPYCNPGIYDAESPHLAGYCSEENLAKFSDAASIVVHPVGRGRVILIAENPNFRAFWHGSSRLLINAVMFGDLVNP